MRSWEVRVAVVLAALGVLPGLGCLYVAYLALRTPDDFFFLLLPLIGCGALVVGVVIVGGAVSLALGLASGKPRARLQALLLGGCLGFGGLLCLSVTPVAGLLLLAYGGALVWLMLRPAAQSDLGGLRRSFAQPAPWGSTPGTKVWSDDPPQQGPWSPDPRTLPVMSWKDHSGPRPPWWQTWQAGLAQGIPLWELVLLVVAAVAFLAGLVLVLLGTHGSSYLGTLGIDGRGWLGLLLVGATIVVVAWLERRLRARLATRR